MEYKATCDACRAAKLRCSGHMPLCVRCFKTGRVCTFSKKKYRKRSPDSSRRNGCLEYVLKNILPVVPVNDYGSLYKRPTTTYTELAWALMETLLLSHWSKNSGTVHMDVIFHMASYQSHCRYENFSSDIDRFRQIVRPLYSNGVDGRYNAIAHVIKTKFSKGHEINEERKEQFQLYREVVEGSYNPKISFERVKSESPLLYSMSRDVQDDTPNIVVKFDCQNLKKDSPVSIKVYANKSFRLLFGWGNQQLEEKLSNSMIGFLPYGASIISLLVASREDLQHFMDIQCAKAFSSVPSALPFLMEFPGFVNMNLKRADNPALETWKSGKFEIISLVRSLKDTNSMHEEVYLQLLPKDPVDYDFLEKNCLGQPSICAF